MSERKFICKESWARHTKGTIITEWEWKKINSESRNRFFEEYLEEEIVQEQPKSKFESKLEKELKDKGIKTEFKHSNKGGKPSLDATFTFDENEK